MGPKISLGREYAGLNFVHHGFFYIFIYLFLASFLSLFLLSFFLFLIFFSLFSFFLSFFLCSFPYFISFLPSCFVYFSLFLSLCFFPSFLSFSFHVWDSLPGIKVFRHWIHSLNPLPDKLCQWQWNHKNNISTSTLFSPANQGSQANNVTLRQLRPN